MTIPLNKWIRDDVGKYSFVTHTMFKGGVFYIYYEKDGEERVKKLPYRVNKTRLENTISKIKKEVDWAVKRVERYKNLVANEKEKEMFIGYETGEDDE